MDNDQWGSVLPLSLDPRRNPGTGTWITAYELPMGGFWSIEGLKPPEANLNWNYIVDEQFQGEVIKGHWQSSKGGTAMSDDEFETYYNPANGFLADPKGSAQTGVYLAPGDSMVRDGKLITVDQKYTGGTFLAPLPISNPDPSNPVLTSFFPQTSSTDTAGASATPITPFSQQGSLTGAALGGVSLPLLMLLMSGGNTNKNLLLILMLTGALGGSALGSTFGASTLPPIVSLPYTITSALGITGKNSLFDRLWPDNAWNPFVELNKLFGGK